MTSDERVDAMLRAHRDGFVTTDAMADHLGATKNSVAGLNYRRKLGLFSRDEGNRKAQRSKKKNSFVRKPPKLPATIETAPDPKDQKPFLGGYRYRRDCAWPMWLANDGPEVEKMVCGAPTGGHVYCPSCRKRAHVKEAVAA